MRPLTSPAQTLFPRRGARDERLTFNFGNLGGAWRSPRRASRSLAVSLPR